MQHYVAKTHFWNQEASVTAPNHHCELCQLGCVYPESRDSQQAKKNYAYQSYKQEIYLKQLS
jgi:hypothetical protein